VGYCRNPRRNVNSNTADFLALQMDLTKLDAATH
jgi:hypothetical protein